MKNRVKKSHTLNQSTIDYPNLGIVKAEFKLQMQRNSY